MDGNSESRAGADMQSLLKDSLAKIRELKAKLKQVELSKVESIAVVGLGCRFPGGGDTPEAFWRSLADGVDAVREIPVSRWRRDAIPDGVSGTWWAGLLEKVDEFDARFFGIAPHEATRLDPQQRLLLEVVWEALEDAGQTSDALSGSQTGVFVGMAAHDYQDWIRSLAPTQLDVYCGTGNWSSTAAGRISYVFGLQGPCVAVDTACSSSLVAIHLACQSLRTGESALAVAGGVNLILSAYTMCLVGQTQALSPTGRCNPFEAGANGYVRGEGCGIVVLKRLSDAQRDGDRIWALIRGSAINQDGRSTGLTAPNVLAQQALIRRALENAGVSPAQVGYVEAHGTGTSLGDPIELEALKEVLGRPRPDGSSCAVGALKTNMGHLESAAGAAGLMKVILALRYGKIPRQLRFQKLNPRVSLEGSSLVISDKEIQWPATATPRIGGVSAFGISGTNAHVVLEEAPPSAGTEAASDGAVVILPLSAKSPEALLAQASAYRGFLSDAPAGEATSLVDITYTASLRRTHHEHRMALVAASRQEMVELLDAFKRGEEQPGIVRSAARAEARPKVVFVFPGQGSQWVGMGRQLLIQEPIFRAAMEDCDQAIRNEAGWSLLDELRADDSRSRLADIDVVHPALFAIGVALSALWRSWGVEPDAVVGHSMGEVTAAHVAGALTLPDATRLICRRSKLLKRVSGKGGMVLVGLSIEKAEQVLRGHEGRVVVGVSNSPSFSVLSGEPSALSEIIAELEREHVFCRRVKVDVASHSPQMDPLLGELYAALDGLNPSAAQVPMYSTVTGELCEGESLGARYWVRNLRDTVLFSRAVEGLVKGGHALFVEMSPHPILVPSVEECLRGKEYGVALASLRRDYDERRALLESFAALFVHGYAVDWKRQYPKAGRCVSLPAYPWQRRRYWLDVQQPAAHDQPLISDGAADTLRQVGPDPLAGWLYDVEWVEQPFPEARSERASAPRRFLILADRGGVGAALAMQLEARGDSCVLLHADAREELALQLRSLMEATSTLDGVVYLWGLDVPSTDVLSVSALDTAQQACCIPVLSLVKQLSDLKASPRLWLVTRGAQPVSKGRIAVAQAPLWGLGRVAALEHPEIWGGLVDLDPAAREGESRRLAETIRHLDDEDQLAFRGDHRYVARLVKSDVPQPPVSLTLRADASYLVTGGLGSLGLQLARWLVSRGARHLVLTGRTPLSGDAREDAVSPSGTRGRVAAVRALEAQGVTVTVASVDVGDKEAMAGVLKSLSHPLAGVIHAAGVAVSHRLAGAESVSTLRSTFQAKVKGTWVLHELTRDLPLSFFVLFSSAASIWGGLEQGHYAAANHFMDAVAHERRALGIPATSLNWGLWADGKLTGAGAEKFKAIGLGPMPTDLALEAMERVALVGKAQQVVANVDWQTFQSIYETRGRRQLLERLGIVSAGLALPEASEWRDNLSTISVAAGRKLLIELVSSHVAQVLGYSAGEHLETARGFFQLGMDSLMAVKLMKGLSAALGQRFPTVLAFEHATVAALAAYLGEVLVPSPAAETQSSSPTEQAAEPEPVRPEPSEAVPVAADRAKRAPIAIVGMGCRFPGGADDPERFWQNIVGGLNAVTEVPPERWDVDRLYDPDPSAPGKTYSRHGGFLEDVDLFDPVFFGIAPRDAVCMDPQHRLLLEVAWEALEHAGQPPTELAGTKTGVFVGITMADYARILEERGSTNLDAYQMTGSSGNFAAGRLSYILGCQGPSMAVDTACSSSLVAVHLACESLQLGDCDLAMAGGVNLILSPNGHIITSKAKMLSVTGACRAFDAAADGMVRAEGCGVVVLKRLSDAVAAGDTILAVIRGSAVNQDGATSGLTVPNKHAQEALIRRALDVAGLDPRAVSYVEAHGTGTPLGDPIELRALGAALCSGRPRSEPLRVGSVKTNIGHPESAAGVAGLIKMVLALQHREIPPHLHLQNLNPHLDWDELAIEIPLRRAPWLQSRRIGGVSSFGASGTNAHLVLEEAPPRAARQAPEDERAALLSLSAKDPAALSALARAYQRFLAGSPSDGAASLHDIAYTAGVRRSHHGQRVIAVGSSRAELAESLGAFVRGEAHPSVVRGQAERGAKSLVTFVFSGQGSQWVGMGRELLLHEPSFRAVMETVDRIVSRHADWSLLDELAAPQERSRLHETEIAQPAIFAIQVALSALWESWGVTPAAVMGHSVGEIAAAHVAGILSLEDAVHLAVTRGRLMRRAAGLGKMASVAISFEEATRLVKGHGDKLAIAAVNDARSVVLSGEPEAVSAVVQRLERDQINCRPLRGSIAFHSPQMAPLQRELRTALSGIAPRRAAISMISTVTGARVSGEELDAEYWAKNLREPVQFSRAVGTAIGEGHRLFVEIGPHPVLSNNLKQCLAERSVEGHVAFTLRRDKGARRCLLQSLGALYAHGYDVDWKRLYPKGGYSVALPTYPWQRKRYWVEGQARNPLAETLRTALRGLIDAPGGANIAAQLGAEATFTAEELPLVERLVTALSAKLAEDDRSALRTPAPLAAGVGAVEATFLEQLRAAPLPERRGALERWLQKAAAQTIGFTDPAFVDPGANLRELGMDSLMNLELRSRIEAGLGVKLSVNWLFTLPTVASLVEHSLTVFDRDSVRPSAQRRTPLVPIQAAGNGAPFFCVHPYGGPVLCYSELARHLGTERPFYGLQARGLDDDQEPDDRCEDMAARYVEAIRSVQPNGPYLIGGWSFGGLLAFEMANQLIRASEKVALLAVIDGFFSGWHSPEYKLWQFVQSARMINPEASFDVLKQLDEHDLIALILDGATRAGIYGFTESVKKLSTAHAHALQHYVAPRYPGRITYFRAMQQPPVHSFGQVAEPYGTLYQPLAKLSSQPIELYQVPGDHYTMLRGTHVRILAERLSECLRTAEAL